MLLSITNILLVFIFLNRAFKLGYTKECYSVANILSDKDRSTSLPLITILGIEF